MLPSMATHVQHTTLRAVRLPSPVRGRLCYLFCRCTRSVSVCPPAYYAHLAAERGKIMCLHADSSSDTASSAGAGPQHAQQICRRLVWTAQVPKVPDNMPLARFCHTLANHALM